MSKIKRVILIVLDSFGIGEMPDAESFGDKGSNTFKSCYKTGVLDIPNMKELGLFNIEGVDFGMKAISPKGAFGRLAEASMGKDTTVGHWEIGGVVSKKPLPTYPEGFPKELIDEFEKKTGRQILCNKPYSGTKVISDFGQEHIKTGALIVYTSADSVWQIAAHEDIVPIETLYEYCQIARDMLTGEHGVGRVIARPFAGEYPNFTRTSNRHDFSLLPPSETFLDSIKSAGLDTIAVGKINDIFAGKGITEFVRTVDNSDGIAKTLEYIQKDGNGLLFVNLVDFDMKYGHRNDAVGYAKALNTFDRELSRLLPALKHDDLLMITADHGCDPGTLSTDHSREYIPILIHGEMVKAGVNLNTRNSFSDIGKTVCEVLGVKTSISGVSFKNKIILDSAETDTELIHIAEKAREKAYSPYSEYKVGAALLCKNGTIYTGCNIESATYSPTNCAERTAFFKAISEGEREFQAIAVVGGKDGEAIEDKQYFFPCGVCRQVMTEFCEDDFVIIATKSESDFVKTTLAELMPNRIVPKK